MGTLEALDQVRLLLLMCSLALDQVSISKWEHISKRRRRDMGTLEALDQVSFSLYASSY